jgi:hypothetical protein
VIGELLITGDLKVDRCSLMCKLCATCGNPLPPRGKAAIRRKPDSESS